MTKIFVLEDHVSIRSAYQSLLTRDNSDIEVEGFDSSAGAIHRLLDKNSSPPDLILTDIDLSPSPGESIQGGVSFARFVRDRHPSIPMIACSGRYDRLAEEDEALFKRVFLKGVGPDRTQDMIAQSIKFAREHAQRIQTEVCADFALPFVIVHARQDEPDEAWHSQIEGEPAIYGSGVTREESKAALLETMEAYRSELELPDESIARGALRRVALLRDIFGVAKGTDDNT